MAASAAKPKNTATRATRRPTPKQSHIITTKQEHPDLNTLEVAAICETSHSHVLATYKRYGIDNYSVDQYKTHRANVFAGIQDRILSSVTNKDIQKASLFQKAGVVGLLYDKERLELDKSTSNVGVVVDLIKRLQAQEGSG